MTVGVAVDQDRLLHGEPCFFIFTLNDTIVLDQGIAEVVFRGPSVLKTGRTMIGVRAWIEADYEDLDIRRPEA